MAGQQRQEPASTAAAAGPASTLERRLEAARTAAQQAVVGSSQEAAMAAAERAVRAGGCVGVKQRGVRLGANTAVLTDFDMLPVRRPCSCVQWQWLQPAGWRAGAQPGTTRAGAAATADAAALCKVFTRGSTCLVHRHCHTPLSHTCVPRTDTSCVRRPACCCMARPAAASRCVLKPRQCARRRCRTARSRSCPGR